jgi:hypothetical protein
LNPATAAYRLPGPCDLDPGKSDVMLTARVRRPVPVSGKLTFPDGSPAPWIPIEVSGSGGPGIAAGWEGRYLETTAADGSFEVQLMPGQSYTIKVVDQKSPWPALSGVEVREGVPLTGLNLTQPRGPADQGQAPPSPGSKP